MDNYTLWEELLLGLNSGFHDLESKRSTNGKLSFPSFTVPSSCKLTFFRKKMNFTTDLPKWDPLVSYIVASAVKCEKFFPAAHCEAPSFRMHAVILSPNAWQVGDYSVSSEAFNFILCHVRWVDQKKPEFPSPGLGVRTRRAFTEDLTCFPRKLSEPISQFENVN